MIYSAVAALLVFGSCSTAYQTAQTPDDVYHSPVRQQQTYATGNQRATQAARSQEVEETFDEEDGDNYVTYADEDEERYDYARRIDRFSRGYSGSYWDGYYFDGFGSSMYMNNFYGFNSWNRFGWNSWYGPSMSIGFGWGRPWGSFGGWYGNPWYGGMYGSGWYGGGWGHGWYGNGWYGGGWGNGWYGGGYPWYGGHGGYYVKPRPSNSWGPRGSSGTRVYNSGTHTNGYRPNSNGSAPRRTFDSNSGRPVNVDRQGSSTRRTFDRAPGERPATRPAQQPQRQERSSRDYQRNYDRGNSAPQRQSQPSYTPERSAPQRSYTPSSSPSSSPAPSRTYRPRGR